ncbi:MAG: hypothetical protein LEGION0398_MBIBDBAK_01054 [Legionellaceae bacterium]
MTVGADNTEANTLLLQTSSTQTQNNIVMNNEREQANTKENNEKEEKRKAEATALNNNSTAHVSMGKKDEIIEKVEKFQTDFNKNIIDAVKTLKSSNKKTSSENPYPSWLNLAMKSAFFIAIGVGALFALAGVSLLFMSGFGLGIIAIGMAGALIGAAAAGFFIKHKVEQHLEAKSPIVTDANEKIFLTDIGAKQDTTLENSPIVKRLIELSNNTGLNDEDKKVFIEKIIKDLESITTKLNDNPGKKTVAEIENLSKSLNDKVTEWTNEIIKKHAANPSPIPESTTPKGSSQSKDMTGAAAHILFNQQQPASPETEKTPTILFINKS